MFRSLHRAPAFSLGIILTLGLSLAATAFVFTLLNRYLLRPLPYDHARQLVVVYEHSLLGGRKNISRVTFANALDVRDRVTAFAEVALLRNESATIRGPNGTEVAFVQRVTTNTFTALGVRAALGTVFRSTDPSGGERSVVLADALWRRRFQADAAIVGRLVDFDGVAYRVVGVMAADFRIPTADDHPQAWLAMAPEDFEPLDRVVRRHHLFATLAPGRSLASAQAELDQVAEMLRQIYPATNVDRGLVAVPLREDLLGGFGRLLLLLQGAVLLVLVIACLNCFCLLVARGLDRRREFALRLALGARRRDVFRQVFLEALLLTGPAAGLALLLVEYALAALDQLLPPAIALQKLGSPDVDLTVLLTVAAGTLLVTFVFAAVSLRQSHQIDLEATLRDGGRPLGSLGASRATRTLLTLQIALAVALLICASLLWRSQTTANRVAVGFPIEEIDQYRVGLRGGEYDAPAARRRFTQQLLNRVRTLPGVADAAATNLLIVRPPGGYRSFVVTGDRLLPGESPRRAAVRPVTHGFARTLGLQLQEGRWFDERDQPNRPRVAVVSASLARHYWTDSPAVGCYLRLEGDTQEWIQVIGVVSDHRGVGHPPEVVDSIYLSMEQDPPPGGFTVVLRMQGSFLGDETLQRALWEVDPDMMYYLHRPLSAVYANASWQMRYLSLLIAAFATLALLLAVGGIYAVHAFYVTQRRPEFGMRMALGASEVSVHRLVLREALGLTVVGAGLGALLGLAGAFGLRTFLFGIEPFDPLTYAGAIALVVLASAAAAVVPARQATRVDPVEALRSF
jgi:putative ABC transport system permease protein